MAKLLIFRFSHIKQGFFPGCLWKSLHIHGPPVLRTCHWACYIARPAFLFRMASEAKKNTPSGLTLSSWHSQAVKLTANGIWPSKWTGHNKALTQGSPSVTAYVSTHSYRHIEKNAYTHQKDNAPPAFCYEIPIHSHTTQTILSMLPLRSFGWVKSSKTPALYLTCLPPQL